MRGAPPLHLGDPAAAFAGLKIRDVPGALRPLTMASTERRSTRAMRAEARPAQATTGIEPAQHRVSAALRLAGLAPRAEGGKSA